MKDKRNSIRPIRRLSKILFATLGGVAILMAVALGVFRLLVAQIPEYQTEIKNWVAAELGLVVDFETLDARLGLKGPELTLRETSIGSGTEFLQADQAIITLDPIALLLARRVDVSRLTLDGVRLTVERDLEGTFRLGDYALESGSETLAESIADNIRFCKPHASMLEVERVARLVGIHDFVVSLPDGYSTTIRGRGREPRPRWRRTSFSDDPRAPLSFPSSVLTRNA